MQFRQRSLFYKTTFDCGEEELTCTYETSMKKTGASIPYHTITNRTLYTREKWWPTLLYASVICVTEGLMIAVFIHSLMLSLRFEQSAYLIIVPFVVVLGALLQKPAGFFLVSTAMPNNPIIRILEDKQHTAILDEIWKRRKEQIRKKFAQVDFDKPYYEEAQKFNRLREQDIITEQEYQYARQKIAAMKEKAAPTLPGEMRMN